MPETKGRKEALKQKLGTHKKILPFVTQFQPSLYKLEKHTYGQTAFNTKPAVAQRDIQGASLDLL